MSATIKASFGELDAAYRAHLVRALGIASQAESSSGGIAIRLARKMAPTMDFIVIVSTICYLILLSFSTAPSATDTATSVYSALRAPFALVYTIDLLVRLIARGPFSSPRRGRAMAYYALELVPDIFIVAASWLEFMPREAHPYASRLTGVRALRLLEPISRVDFLSLREVLATIYISAGDLAGVAGMLAIFQFLFGCVATQLWRGVLQGQCAFIDPSIGQPIIPGAGASMFALGHPIERWFKRPQPCALTCDRPYACSPATGAVCNALVAPFSNASVGLVQQYCARGDAPDFGQTHYDNIFPSMLNAFFVAMQQGWSSAMFAVEKTKGYRDAVFVFFASHIVVSGFVLVPLFLSVLTANFSVGSKWEKDRLERLAEAAIARLRPGDAADVSAAAQPSEEEKELPAEGPFFPDVPGPLHRRRRLDSLVNLESVEAAISQIEADLLSRSRRHRKGTHEEKIIDTCDDQVVGEKGGATYFRPPWDGKPPPEIPGESSFARASRRVAQRVSASATSATRWLSSSLALRGQFLRWQQLVASMTLRPAWGHFTNALLLCNAIVWALPHQGMSAAHATTLYGVDAFFGVVSFAASIAVIFSRKGKDGASSITIWLDAACTLCGFLEILLSYSDGRFLYGGSSFGGSVVDAEKQLQRIVDAFHIVRVVRVVLLMTAWFEGRRLLRRLILAGPLAVGALSLFAIYIGVFAFWGRQLLGPMYPAGSTIFPNFQSLHMGVIASFQFADGQDIDRVVKEHTAAIGWPSALFFLLMSWVGSFLVLNIFIATLVESSIVMHTQIEEAALGYETPLPQGTSATATPIERMFDHLFALLSFISPVAPDQSVASSSRKTSLMIKTGKHGAAESATITVLPVADGDVAVHVRITANTITTIVAGEEHAIREWSLNRMLKWLYSLVRLAPPTEEKTDSSDPQGLSPSSPSRRSASPSRRTLPPPEATDKAALLPSRTTLMALQHAARSLNSSPMWILLSIIAIVWASINLIFEVPRLDFCDDPAALAIRGISQPVSCIYLDYFNSANIVLAIFFFFELIVNACARGVFPATSGTFFVTPAGVLDWWSILDVLVVIGAIGGWVNSSLNVRSTWVRPLRAGRALRALRILERFSSLRTTASSLIRSTVRSADPLCLTFLLCVATAFSGMRLYGGGGMNYCSSDSYPFRLDTIIVPTTNRSACGATPITLFGDSCVLLPTVQAELNCRANATGASMTPVWTPYVISFDNFRNALLSAFELLAGQNWIYFLRQYMSATDDQPGTITPSTSRSVPAFFIIAIVVLQHFSVGLFGGFIARTYFADRSLTLGLGALSPLQRVWVQNLQAALEVRAPWTLRAPTSTNAALSRARAAVFAFLHYPSVEALTVLLIVSNLIVLAAPSVSQTPATALILSTASDVFTGVFLLELLLRVFGTGVSQFSRDVWDVIDAVVTVFSIIGLILASSVGDVGRTIYVLSRLVRVLRVFRLARFISGLRRMLDVLAKAALPVVNVIVIHALIVYVFAIVGMSLFEGTRYGHMGSMSRSDVNFDSFISSYVSLWQCTTGENLIMLHDLMPSPPFCDPSIQGSCGTWWFAVTFFVTFFVLTRFLLLSLISTIMMHILTNIGFVDLTTGMIRLSHDMKERFALEWGKLDPDATHVIPQSKLLLLLTRLPPPLGFAVEDDGPIDDSVPPSLAARSRARRLLESMHLPPVDDSTAPFIPQGSIFSNLMGRMNISRRMRATVVPHDVSSPVSPSSGNNGPSSAFGSPRSPTMPLVASLRALSVRSLSSSARSLSPMARSPSMSALSPADIGPAAEARFHFHTVLTTLIAHHNSELMQPPKVAMKGHHASGGVTLAAMMIMKRAFKRFLLRRALRLTQSSAATDATAAKALGGEEKVAPSHTAIAVNAGVPPADA